MEEKKSLKIDLSTFFLIIAIIVIAVMGYFIHKVSKEKIIAEEQVKELNKEVASLENTTSVLQEKLDSVSNTNNDSNSNNNSNKFSDDTIKKSLQEYLDLVGIREGSPSALLQKLNLLSSEVDYSDTDTTSDGYKKTNIKYSDYKKAMMNYMTEEWFNTRFTNGYKEQDGLLYYFNGGATGMEFKVESINIKGDYSDSSYIAKVYNIHLDGSNELENIEFAITNYNGKCVISYCD